MIQKKTGRPVEFEITEQTRTAIGEWLAALNARKGRYLFLSRFQEPPHLSTRQYARIVHRWVERAGLDSSACGTHSLRRTKPAQIYKRTGKLRTVQLLLRHTKLESTVRYPGIEVDDALAISGDVSIAVPAQPWPRCVGRRVAIAPQQSFLSEVADVRVRWWIADLRRSVANG